MENAVKISVLLEIYGNLLTEKQRLLLNEYYNKDISLSEIAENQNITRQAVRDNLKKGENNLFEFEKELCLMEKQNILNNKINDLINVLNKNKLEKEDITYLKKELKKIIN